MLGSNIRTIIDKFSLKSKIIFVGIFGISIIAVTIIVIAIINNSIRNQNSINNYINRTTLSIDNDISTHFYERYGDIQAFALNYILNTNKTSEMTQIFNNYTSMYGIYDLILFVDTKGNYIASNNKSPKGDVLNLSKLIRNNYSNSEWFKNAMQENYTVDKENGFSGTYFEDVHIDPIILDVYGKKIFTTSFSTVVKNLEGKKIGVLTNRANFSWVGDEVKNAYLMARDFGNINLEILLLNKKGELIIDFTEESDKMNKALDPSYSSEKSKILIKSPLIKEVVDHNNGTELYFDQFSKENIFISFNKIKNKKFIPSINWSLILSIPEKDIFGSNNKQTFITIIIIVLSWLLSFILALYLAITLSNKFFEVAKKLGITSESILSSSENLTILFEKVAKNATKQSDSQQQNSASLNEILAMINKTVENVKGSKEIATSVAKEAQDGNIAMEKMEKSVIKIEETNTSLEDIRKIITQINTKTSLINDIVSKTELLSLNASIESARAGEHGKGFAVVAEEVGNLAKVSGQAANEIETLIASSAIKVDSIIEETKLKVIDGIEASKIAVKIFKEISEKIEEIKFRVDSINDATNEQKIGVEKTTEANNFLSLLTQENTDSAAKALLNAKIVEEDSNKITMSMNEIKFLLYGR